MRDHLRRSSRIRARVALAGIALLGAWLAPAAIDRPAGSAARAATASKQLRPGTLPTARKLSVSDADALAHSLAEPWPGIQGEKGRFPDYLDSIVGSKGTRYGDAIMGYALLRLGVRDHDKELINSGLRGINWATTHYLGSRTRGLQSVFENWSVAASYNLARRNTPGNPIFSNHRGQWEHWLRYSRAERAINAAAYGNHWLVDSLSILETLKTGLHSGVHDSILGGQRHAAKAAVVSLVNTRAPDLAPRHGAFLFSDPPDNPLAYQGLSLGMYARLIRSLGPRASDRARETLRQAADATWLDVAPDGDSAYFGRSQSQVWGPAGAAYGAEVAANLPGTSATREGHYRALGERSLARIRDDYPIGKRGQFFVPALAQDLTAGRRVLDNYAGAPSMDGIALLMVDYATDEIAAGQRPATVLAADRRLSRTIGSGDGKLAVVRQGDVWFAVRMHTTGNPRHYGDLRYDFGLVSMKRLGDSGWKDVLPIRPATTALTTDTAGPAITGGGHIVGLAEGSAMHAGQDGLVRMGLSWISRSGRVLAQSNFHYAAAGCGVRLSFRAPKALSLEYSAFFKHGPPDVTANGANGGGQAVTVSSPVNVKLESGYGSGQDAHLVRARIRFHAKRNEAVRITVC